ncbi:MAG: CHAT domain-containing protein [Alphaproteobacteria bacterium]|nr:CHAT domain-containing protein [Alphaproteobacteria bacterium]
MRDARRSPAILAVAFGLALGGCAETMSGMAISSGQHASYVERFPTDESWRTADPDDLLAVCIGLSELRLYDRFARCADIFLSRFADHAQFSAAQLRARGPGDFIAPILVAQAQMRIDTKELAAAERSVAQALRIVESETKNAMGDTRDRVHLDALGVAGHVQALLGRREAALGYVKRLEEFQGQFGTDSFWIKAHIMAIARIHVALGDLPTAAAVLQRPSGKSAFFQAIDAFNVINPMAYLLQPLLYGTTDPNAFLREQEIKLSYMQARVLFEMQRWDAAAPLVQELLANKLVDAFPDLKWQALYMAARMDARAGGNASAAARLRQALDIFERSRASIASEVSKIGFSGDKQDAYALLVDVLQADGKAAEALAVTEQAKARALVDVLAAKREFGRTPTERAQSRAALDRLEIIERTRAAAPALRGRAGEAKSRSDAVELSAQVRSVVAVEGIGLAEIQAALRPDEAGLSFFVAGERAYAYLVLPGAIRTHGFSAGDLGRRVEAFRQALAGTDIDLAKRLGKQLHDDLLAPLGVPQGTSLLTVVPHGPLHYLPFAALHDGQRWLVERMAIRLLPSFGTQRYIKPASSDAGAVLIYGNPTRAEPQTALPGAEAEAREIAARLPGSLMFLQRDATESRLKAIAQAPRVLHIASHGEFNGSDPLGSRLLLAADGRDDGDLTASEIYDLALDGSLVVLSACETGLGALLRGDEVIGLTRGFVYAGARSVVASLWQVSDEATKALMVDLHGRRVGQQVAAALRDAMLRTMRDFPHPAHWAAFQVYGAP